MKTRIAIMVFLSLGATGLAQQQQPTPGPSKPVEPSAKEPAAPPPEFDLDKLLGLPGSKPVEPAKPDAGETVKPRDEEATDLSRRLTKPELDEAFRQAVDLMGRAADRLETGRDTSLTTQRLQEDALRKLDQLIKQAEQNQQQQRQKQRQQQQQQSQNQPNQPQQRQSQQRQQDARGTNTEELPEPARRDGDLGPEAGRGAVWGSLPARVRDALQQGNSDKYSTLYQRLTELYYQRLAEEKPR